MLCLCATRCDNAATIQIIMMNMLHAARLWEIWAVSCKCVISLNVMVMVYSYVCVGLDIVGI